MEYFRKVADINRVLKNSDDRDESDFESGQGASPRSCAEALRAASNATQIQNRLNHERVVAAHRKFRRSLEPAGHTPSTVQAALETSARSHNHGLSESFSTLLTTKS